MINIHKNHNSFNREMFDQFLRKEYILIEEAYIKFLEMYNGGTPEGNIVQGIDDEYITEFSIQELFGVGVEKYSDVIQVYNGMKDRLPFRYLAIAQVEGGDLICINIDSTSESHGSIYYWEHDNEMLEDEYRRDMIYVASSFEELLRMVSKY